MAAEMLGQVAGDELRGHVGREGPASGEGAGHRGEEGEGRSPNGRLVEENRRPAVLTHADHGEDHATEDAPPPSTRPMSAPTHVRRRHQIPSGGAA